MPEKQEKHTCVTGYVKMCLVQNSNNKFTDQPGRCIFVHGKDNMAHLALISGNDPCSCTGLIVPT